MIGNESDTQLDFYSRSADAWEAMYADCEKARKSIELEQYILKDDDAGHRFLKLFAEKARQGVDVQLMLDGFGSRELQESPTLDEFRKSGGVAYFYNPVNVASLLAPKTWFPRNHIKTMLIDKEVGYAGSACMAQEMADWHDVHVRFQGPLVEHVKGDFAQLWHAADRNRIPPVTNEPRRGLVSYVVAQRGAMPNRIYRQLLQAIKGARHKICIVTPYFLPPWLLRHALRKAVRRGVDVQIMVGEKSDVRWADFVSHSYYPQLFRHGVRIFHYRKTMMHAKYAIIDDSWATVGSTNMDYLSLLRNREANLFITDPAVVAELRADYEECLQDSVEVNRDFYSRQPLWQRASGHLLRSLIRRAL